ncbi:hypothetical protein MKW98_020396 [Papaver atlanticum]|uniref:Serine hydrolase domain-containing protein n=1 Tax=Papaver atlanticum TaxID=357466 RepID=A0AAD4RVI8_9MAGN|nr:hypothetical protein MKW98_020396 [Papaver atlanticum]
MINIVEKLISLTRRWKIRRELKKTMKENHQDQGKSDVEGFYDPPYYGWYQFEKETTEYRNFDGCLEYVGDIMIKQGPFGGLLGFSHGGIFSADSGLWIHQGLLSCVLSKFIFVF